VLNAPLPHRSTARAVSLLLACSAAGGESLLPKPDGGEGLAKCKGYRREAVSEGSIDALRLDSFLSIRSRVCSMLPSDTASRR